MYPLQMFKIQVTARTGLKQQHCTGLAIIYIGMMAASELLRKETIHSLVI